MKTSRRKPDSWNRVSIEGLQISIGRSGRAAITLSARVDGKWVRLYESTTLELVFGTVHEMTAGAIKQRARMRKGRHR